MIFVHGGGIKVSFLVDSFFTLDDSCKATTASLVLPEEFEQEEPDNFEEEIKKVCNVADQGHDDERGSSALKHAKSLCKFYSPPMPITVAKAQGRTEDDIWAFTDYSRLRATVKTKDANFSAARLAWEQKTAVYERGLVRLKLDINNTSADLWKIKELTSVANALRTKLISSQKELEKLEEKLPASLQILEKSTTATLIAEQVASDFITKFQASKKKLKQFSTTAQVAKITLPDHVAMLEKKRLGSHCKDETIRLI